VIKFIWLKFSQKCTKRVPLLSYTT